MKSDINLQVVLKCKCARQNHIKGICLYCHLEVIIVATKKRMHNAAANKHLDNHSYEWVDYKAQIRRKL